MPLRGTLTLLLEDPPQRVDVEPGGLVAVHPGTPMQARNETDEEILFFAYGAPPVQRQRRVPRRRRRRASASTRATASPSAANASSKRHFARSASSGAFEIARSSTAGTPASAHARSTPNPSIASTSHPVPPPTLPRVAIGSTCASGSAARTRASSAASGSMRSIRGSSRRRIDHVAVDRLRAEDERRRLDAARAGDADVEHRVRPPLGERARRLQRRLDRADPAARTSRRRARARAPARWRRRRASP